MPEQRTVLEWARKTSLVCSIVFVALRILTQSESREESAPQCVRPRSSLHAVGLGEDSEEDDGGNAEQHRVEHLILYDLRSNVRWATRQQSIWGASVQGCPGGCACAVLPSPPIPAPSHKLEVKMQGGGWTWVESSVSSQGQQYHAETGGEKED